MLMLLIMSVISANRMINENTTAQLQAEALVSSATIANDMLLEIMSKKFDAYSDTLGYQATSAFSPYDTTKNEWGPSLAERGIITYQADTSYNGRTYKSIKGLNDMDDYDGYQRIVNFGNISGFIVKVKVYYVNAGTPDVLTTSKTYFKKIEVTVEQPLYLSKVTYTGLASY